MAGHDVAAARPRLAGGCYSLDDTPISGSRFARKLLARETVGAVQAAEFHPVVTADPAAAHDQDAVCQAIAPSTSRVTSNIVA